jgi:predicted nicotinamide N-methyase
LSAAVPTGAALASLLDRCAPLSAVPLCPEIRAFTARSLVEIWEAAEALAGGDLPAPFWAWPWAGGAALARVLLDRPELVRGQRVLDFGCGGGVASFAAVLAGARVVIANDIDPWALEVARLAAERQHLRLPTLLHDYAADPTGIEAYDVVVCSELAYDRAAEPMQRAALDRAAAAGARVLLADSGRTYFRSEGLRLLARHELPVPRDLEGVDVRDARVYERVG